MDVIILVYMPMTFVIVLPRTGIFCNNLDDLEIPVAAASIPSENLISFFRFPGISFSIFPILPILAIDLTLLDIFLAKPPKSLIISKNRVIPFKIGVLRNTCQISVKMLAVFVPVFVTKPNILANFLAPNNTTSNGLIIAPTIPPANRPAIPIIMILLNNFSKNPFLSSSLSSRCILNDSLLARSN